ncbi:MAG: ornithine--oxo-acid transaminase, partial [Caldimonas sp.]
MDARREVDVGDPAVALDDLQDLAIDRVETCRHGEHWVTERTNIARLLTSAQEPESTFPSLTGTLLLPPERAMTTSTLRRPFASTPTIADELALPAELERRYGAANYHPLPVTLQRGAGVWLFDTEGRRHLDMMSAYSAVSFGHGHPTLVRALVEQAERLAVTSRAFHSDRLGPFLRAVCETTGMAKALPMNSGAEAVETAIKAVRKWAYKVRKVAEGRAEIIVAAGNFGGRTTTIVGFSSEAQYRDGFGPFAPGFVSVPFGDAKALEAAITANTAAFLVEPIQGEAGIIVPPAGYLARAREICSRHGILLVCDEVQTGLGRTGALLACDHDGIRPDGLVLGKALGGGLLPVSAFLATEELMAQFTPGDHGSTFGGNALAAAVGEAALEKAITPNTAAVLLEPIQGEGGVIVPPEGYLKQVAEICKKHNVLL